MGHFYCANISKLVTSQVYAKGKVSIRQMTDFALKHGITINAAEGNYDDEDMLMQGIETLVFVHWQNGVIEPVCTSFKQRKLWYDYFIHHEFEWDHPNAKIVTNTPVRFTPGMRQAYIEKEIQHIYYIDQ